MWFEPSWFELSSVARSGSLLTDSEQDLPPEIALVSFGDHVSPNSEASAETSTARQEREQRANGR